MLMPTSVCAAPLLDGSTMSWPWALPFLGILLSIASGPLLAPTFWHKHYGQIAAGWSVLAFASVAIGFGLPAALGTLLHSLFAEYMSFIILLFALYTVSGGILVRGQLSGTPAVNAGILLIGTLMASVVGTTGAAMILIRLLLGANAHRIHRAHVVVFFIILVANIGGALSPLGDPPLFVGFLRGVDFFWPAQHLWPQTLLVAGWVLAIFLLVDSWFYRKEQPGQQRQKRGVVHIPVHSLINVPLIVLIVACMMSSGLWQPNTGVEIYGTKLQLQNIVRDILLVVIALASVWLTPEEHRAANGFSWEPIREVAKLFAGIFITIAPVLAMLDAGRNGAFSWLLQLVTDTEGRPREVAFFWLTGGLSAFLDNAPTYAVFFELAGGDAKSLMGPMAGTLASISMGAVYMGAFTYIGNAPNLMVHAIAEERGIQMPSFFAYLFWAALVLIPILLVVTVLPIPPRL
jgi:Na+/H+ antiporter NhaD/arsenite permease-like protein